MKNTSNHAVHSIEQDKDSASHIILIEFFTAVTSTLICVISTNAPPLQFKCLWNSSQMDYLNFISVGTRVACWPLNIVSGIAGWWFGYRKKKEEIIFALSYWDKSKPILGTKIAQIAVLSYDYSHVSLNSINRLTQALARIAFL